MREYWNWITTKISSALTYPSPVEIKDSIVATYRSSTTQLVKSELKDIYQSKEVREAVASKTDQFMQGFSNIIDVAPIRLLWDSPETRHVFFESLKTNALYLGSATFVYGYVVKPALDCIPGWDNSYLELAVGLPIAGFAVYQTAGYLTRPVVGFFVDNTAFNLSLTKVASRSTKHLHENDKCECGDVEKLTGSLTSSIYNFGNYVTVDYFLNNIPVVGPILRKILLPLVYGQGLTEYKIAAGGMCINHRYEVLQKNNIYCFGLGVALFLTVEALEQLLESTTGVRNIWTYNVISYVVYQYYILSAFKNNSPLPGKEKGLDIFYHYRKSTESQLKQLLEDVIPVWWSQQADPLWLKKMKKLYNTKFVSNMVDKSIVNLVGDDMHDLTGFINRPSIRLFFSVQEQDFRDTQRRLNALRQDFLTGLATYLHPSEQTRKFLQGIRSEGTEKALKGVDDFLKLVYLSDVNAAKEAEKVEIQQGLKALEGAKKGDILSSLPEPVKPVLPLATQQVGANNSVFATQPTNLLAPKGSKVSVDKRNDDFLKKMQ